MKGVEVPEEETKLQELEMIFDVRYKDWGTAALEREAKELLKRLKVETAKVEVEELNEELEKLGDSEEDQEKQAEILRKIMVLKGMK